LSDMVRMFRNSTEPGGRDLFACSVAEWVLLQELGRDFGWTPLGTTYFAPGGAAAAAPRLHEYAAGSAADPKIIEAGDARNWARALEDRKHSLERAVQSGLRTADGENRDLEDAAGLTGLIDEFIEYAYGGAFTFALDLGAPDHDDGRAR